MKEAHCDIMTCRSALFIIDLRKPSLPKNREPRLRKYQSSISIFAKPPSLVSL